MAAAKGVQMFDPAEGRVRNIHPDDVQQALDEGLVVETPEDRERREYRAQAGLGELATAAGEGLAKGATLGLSDVVASEIGGDDYRKRRLLRQEEFPLASGGGEVAGAVLPTLLSGGTGLAARAAALTPANLAARTALGVERAVATALPRAAISGSTLARAAGGAARFGAAGATEGALGGAGFALSEAALENELGSIDDIAERAWAGAKSGAIFGLVGGAALGGVAAGAQGAAKSLWRRFGYSGDELAEQANIQALKASGAIQGDFQALRARGANKAQQVGDDLMRYRLKDGRAIVDSWEDVDAIAPKITQAKEEVGAEIGALRERVKDEAVTDAAAEWVTRVRSEILDPLKQDALPAIRARAAKVERQLGDIAERIRVAKVSQAETADYLSKLDAAVIEPMLVTGNPAEVALATRMRQSVAAAGQKATAGGLTRKELTALRRNVLEPLRSAPNAAVATAAGDASDYLARSGITRLAEPVTHGELQRVRSSLQEVIYPKKPPGRGIPAPVPEHAQQLFEVERKLEETLEAQLEAALQRVSPDDVGRYAENKRLYNSFQLAEEIAQKGVQRQVGNRAISLSDYLTGIGSTGPVLGALAGGHLGAAAGLGANFAVSYGHKLLRERGNAFLATLLTRHRRATQRMNGGFAGFFQRARAAAKPTALAGAGAAAGFAVGHDLRRALRAQHNETPEDAYDRIVARAQDIASGRGMSAYAIDEHAPRTGHAMRQVQLRAAQHILANTAVKPKTTNNPNLGALSAQARPDPVQVYDLSRRVRAIEDPFTLLDDLKDGTLSVAATEAVRDVYPRLYAEMQAQAVEGLANSRQLLQYEHRIRLGLLFNLPTDPTLRPEYLSRMQAIYQKPQQQPQGGPQPQNPSQRSNELRSAAQELEQAEPIV